uniref:Ubiquitin-like domain-containing protein n=1 Tax=Setaria viridis TaxID=4556 RepID=A0A4U6SWM3_SETVI|nr:hypothetical protein SEVIR_9G223300v2 [Setaria viridis]
MTAFLRRSSGLKNALWLKQQIVKEQFLLFVLKCLFNLIYVKMMKTVPLDVECTDTVDQVKAKIGAIEGIDKGQQELFFAGIHLEDANMLTDYDIKTNSFVDLYKSHSVADMKVDIEQKGGIRRNKEILMNAGRQLEDNMMLCQCGLDNGQTLHVLVCPTDKLNILVNIEGERTVNLDILMQTQSGGDAELKDTEILKSLHVKNREILMLYRSVQLFIKTWEGKTLTMPVKMSGTTKDVMKKIEEKLPLKEGIYYLHYRGRILSPGGTLRKSKIGSNSTIEIRLRNVEEYSKAERSAGKLASWVKRLN